MEQMTHATHMFPRKDAGRHVDYARKQQLLDRTRSPPEIHVSAIPVKASRVDATRGHD